MLWFFAVACVVSYAIFLLAGSFLKAQAASSSSVVIRDEVEPNTHNLSGMVMVPASCYQLSVRVDRLSTDTYNLTFNTWQDPAVACSTDEVPRQFHAGLSAPAAGVNFFATLDGASFPIVVLPVVVDQTLP